jgi:hypothetical protein
LLKRKATTQTLPKGPKARPPPPSAAEAAFWDSPEPASNTRHRSGTSKVPTSSNLLTDVPSLLDTSADFSIRGPSSPTPGPGRSSAPAASGLKAETKPPPAARPVFDLARLTSRKSVVDDEFDDEPTVMMKKPPLSFAPPPSKAEVTSAAVPSHHAESVPSPVDEPAMAQQIADEPDQEDQEDHSYDGNISLNDNVLSIFVGYGFIMNGLSAHRMNRTKCGLRSVIRSCLDEVVILQTAPPLCMHHPTHFANQPPSFLP